MTDDKIVPVLQVGGVEPLTLGGRWCITMTGDVNKSKLSQMDSVGLILIHSGRNLSSMIATIRTSGWPAAAVPIVAMGSVAQPGGGDQPDLWLTDPNYSELSETLEQWRPMQLSDSYYRIEAAFGAETIGGMAQRLCDVLVEALDALGTPAAAATAHRVAGVAGTLGFADIGAQWLEVSHDPDIDTAALVRDTRRTIAAIVLQGSRAD